MATQEKSKVQARTWLKPEQVNELLDHTDAFAPHLQLRNEIAVLLMYDTGVRVGELCQIDTDHLRLDATPAHLYLPGPIQKHPPDGGTPDPASIEFTSELGTARLLRHYLRSRWKDADALLPSQKSDRMTTAQVRNVVTKLAQTADVRPFTADGGRGDPEEISPHTLRHSVFYRMFVEEERRLKEVSVRLRHGSITTTERIYAHLIMR